MKNISRPLPRKEPKLRRRAFLLSALIAILFLLSLLAVLLPHRTAAGLTADIYQNGLLLQSIDLSAVTESYTFTVVCPTGGSNEISVCPNAIGFTDADCPDHLCVAMGILTDTRLPAVCLPHGLVITLRDTAADPSSDTPDAVTY